MKTAIAIPLIVLIFIFGDIFTKKNVVIDQLDNTFSGITVVDVKGAFLNVSIQGEEREDVYLTGEIKGSGDSDEFSFKYDVADGKLTVWVERPSTVLATNGFIDLKVPVSTEVTVLNASGSIKLNSVRAGSIKLKSSSGSILAENITGNFTCEASSGSLKLINIQGNVAAKTSSGSISASTIDGNFTGESSSGSQKLDNINGSVETKASSGSLRIDNVKGNLSARSNSGSINLNYITGSLKITTSSGSQTGNNIMLTGNSDFKSSSGSINMQLANNEQDLRFILTSSSGSISAFGKSDRNSLRSSTGNIIVTGYTNSGSQRYY
jgi:hypothetical protein